MVLTSGRTSRCIFVDSHELCKPNLFLGLSIALASSENTKNRDTVDATINKVKTIRPMNNFLTLSANLVSELSFRTGLEAVAIINSFLEVSSYQAALRS